MQNQENVCSTSNTINTGTKDPTTPWVCRYSTLWNGDTVWEVEQQAIIHSIFLTVRKLSENLVGPSQKFSFSNAKFEAETSLFFRYLRNEVESLSKHFSLSEICSVCRSEKCSFLRCEPVASILISYMYLVSAACAQWKIKGTVLIRLQIKLSPIFTGQTTPLTKHPPYFYFPLFFNLHP